MRKISLYQKLFVYFTIVILFSLVTVGLITYQRSSSALEHMAERQMLQAASNAVHHTDLYLADYERSVNALTLNRSVQEFMDLPKQRDEYEYYTISNLIEDVLVTPLFLRNPNIAVVYFINKESHALYYFNRVNEALFTEDIQRQKDFLLERTENDGSLSILNHSVLTGSESQMVTITRRIRGLSSIEREGLLAVEFRSADLAALWKGVDLGEYGQLFIVDGNGTYIYHSERRKLGTRIPEELNKNLMESGSFEYTDPEEGKNRVYVSHNSKYAGWKLVVSTPLDELNRSVSDIRNSTLYVGLITLFLALMLAYRFGKSITTPFQLLRSGMAETEKGNWTRIPLPNHRDEVVELMARYNTMVSRLEDAVDRVVRMEVKQQEIQLERQKAEFQSLQLQINPHFLYNTLEVIVCYAVVQESDDISDMVSSLAYMLRYSVQTNVEEITVANELKHVMHYLRILKHRVDLQLEIDVSIQPEYLLCAMVRLTLQPLVENVFQHAFPEGMEDFHYVKVDAGIRDGRFWVSVEDNGVGMTETRLQQMRRKLQENRLAEGETGGRGGIGILNVHRRIQMVFGEEYGLRLESELDRGTTLIMEMPYLVRNT